MACHYAAVPLAMLLGLPLVVASPVHAQELPMLEPGFVALFDGSEASFARWEVTGRDGFALVDGVIETRPGGDDLGLLYYAPQTFADFILRMQFRVADPADNSGVHVRFRDPTQPVPDAVLRAPGAETDFPNRSTYADNGAWLAGDTGFEVQIDDQAGGRPDGSTPDGLDQHRTGAIYDVPLGEQPGEQVYQRGPVLIPGQWFDLEIEVRDHTYIARLNGQQTTRFTNADPLRGTSAADDPGSGYIGVQAIWFNPGHVDFRAIRIHELSAAEASEAERPVRTVSSPVQLTWTSTGNPARPMREPSFLAVDPQGTVWVTDGHHSQFQFLAADGSFQETWGEPGDAAGQFDFVRSDELSFGAVAFAPDGTIYVADTGNDRVQVFAPDRHWLATWGSSGRGDGQFVDPIGIAVGPDGFVHVVDDYRDDVQVFDRNGAFVRRFGEEGTSPGQFLDAGSGIAFDRQGNVLVADFGGDQVERFAPDGTHLDTLGGTGGGNGQFYGPQGLAVDEQGHIYVADSSNYRIQIFATDGAFLTTSGSAGSDPGQFRFPVGLALDGHGHVYVSDTFDHRVQAFRLLAPLAP